MEVSRKYGMAYVTICTWLKRYGNRELLDMRVKITDHQRRLIIRNDFTFFVNGVDDYQT
jgi:hypothetical protein